MATRAVTGRAQWAVLALCAAQFVLIVDVVVVTVALPSIRRDLVIPDGRLSLVGVAYTVTFGSLLVVPHHGNVRQPAGRPRPGGGLAGPAAGVAGRAGAFPPGLRRGRRRPARLA